MKIDSHQHFWKLSRGDYEWLTPELSAIYRDFLPEDLEPLLAKAGIDKSVIVQATDTEAETEYMLELASQHEFLAAVVGWVDMEDENAPARIAEFAKHFKFRGIRPMIQGLKDDKWMLRPALRPAIQALIEHNLCFDALVLPCHLPYLIEFLQNYPNLPVVIDHGAKPEIRNQQWQDWADNMQKIAETSSCYCKLSGLVTEANADWNDDDITLYAKYIIKCFGAERVMFGSDWPVLNLAGDYQKWVVLAEKICEDLSPAERDDIFGGTVKKFYHL